VCEREWEVFLRLEMEFKSCSKTSCFYFSTQKPAVPVLKSAEPVSSRPNSDSVAD
jgi:hypothetical protein